MKKVYFVAMAIILLMVCSNINVFANGVSARHMCVIDSLTGRVLYEKNAYERHGMASTTKIMTAIIALEQGKPDAIATVSQKASLTEGSSLYLKTGDTMTIKDLVYGLMLNSGNDAAVVLAEHVGGNTEAFAGMMTAKAKEIGAKNTNFVNPNGLSDDNHYTTAYDLALITRYALKNPDFAEIVKTKSYKATVINDKRTIALNNHNRLLSQLNGCDGVKTGFTKATGRCLVSSVTRNGWQAICVTLDASSDWADHTSVLNSVFDTYSPRKLITKRQFMRTAAVDGGELDSVRLLANEDLSIIAKKNETLDLEINYILPVASSAPVGFEQQVGEAQIYLNDKLVGTIGLISENAVYLTEKPSYIDNIKRVAVNWFGITNEQMGMSYYGRNR